jgi:hypothetical protein
MNNKRRLNMANGKQRQALSVAARLSTPVVPGYPKGAIDALETEAAKIVADDAERRRGVTRTDGHFVIDNGRLSGFVRDDHTTVRFAGGAVAVTTHD